MKKKTIISVIIIVLLLAAGAAYYYLVNYYIVDDNPVKKTYVAADFPKALEDMSEDVLEKSITDLNFQYDKLSENDHIYVRWINIGILKKRLNDNSGAEEAWLNAVSYNPDQSLAYGNLADLYLYNLAEYEKAEEYYKKVLSMRTDVYAYYFGLAALYRHNMPDKKYQIEDLLLGAAENNIGEAEVYYMYLADYYYREGNDLDKSKYYAKKTLEINPDLESQLPTY